MKRELYAILLSFAMILFGLSSCKRTACDRVICENGSLCDAGNCICAIGYEGSFCETLSRDKFVRGGNYSVNEEGTTSPISQYQATILAGDQINEVKIVGMRDTLFQGQDVIATVTQDTISIARQVVNGYEIEGKGFIRGQQQNTASSYDKATIRITYHTKRLSDTTYDYYGTNGTQPSDWMKN